MNNGILVQDVYGKTGFENSLPKPLLGSTNVIPAPYHFTPSTEWNINYNNLVMVVDTSLITSPVISFLAGGASTTPWSIDWGDGYTDNFSSYNNTTVSHTYSSRGVFIIQVRGNVIAPRLSSQPALTKILSFAQLTSHDYFTAFRLNTNLVELPRTIPANITIFQQTFTGTTKLNDPNVSKWNTSNLTNVNSAFFGSAFNQDLGSWNTGNITDMGGMFAQSSFNNGGSDSINNWNTSNVTDMNAMFQLASSFNQPLNNWNVRKVGTFASMFRDATRFNSALSGWQLGLDTAGTNCTSMFELTSFNQPINDWNTSKVTNMSRIFRANTIFNQSLDTWNTSLVNNMNAMFNLAFAFNQNIGTWNVGLVTDMNGMFGNALAFNNGGSSDINNWNTSNVTNMGSMFINASSFNQPLNSWNVRKVTTFASMFQGATNFNSSLSGWALGADTAGTSCLGMFQSATTFNQDISNWNTSKVTNMQDMFYLAPAFNQPIGSWDTSNNTTFWRMFNGATSFNQPIGSWNTSKATTMIQMFINASAFNQDISGWNLARINVNTGLDDFMTGKTGANALSTTNYDALLIGWNNNKLVGANGVANWRTDLRPNFGGAKYTAGGAAAAARAALVSYGWTITDGGVA